MGKLPTKIFISVSFPRKDPRKQEMEIWVEDFKRRLCEQFHYEVEEIYIFKDPHTAPPGAPIEKEIAEKLRDTEHLICVISDEYLSSPYCLKEYWEYTQRTEGQKGGEPIYVVTKYLRKQDYASETKLKARISKAVEELKKRTNPPFAGHLLSFATERWPEILFESLHDLRRIQLVDDDEGEWSQGLKELATKLIRPRTHFLLDYAALSAYCLGADQYKEGGWGFSLPENVSHYDDEDGYELPSGPYGLNVVILRAVAPIWDRAAFTKECDRLFKSTSIRSTLQSAQDRLPDFAGLLACLENPEKALASLEVRAKTAHTLLNGLDSKSRWTLANLDVAFSSPLYLATVLGCLNNAKEISKNSSQEDDYEVILKRAQLSRDFHLIEDFRNYVDQIINQRENNLLELSFIADNLNVNANERDLLHYIRPSTLWLILGGCSEGQEMLSRVLFANAYREKEVLCCLRDGINSKDAGRRSISLTIALALGAATLKCRGSFPRAIQTLVYEELFQKIRPSLIVPELNCAGWSAILLIAFNDAQQILISNLSLLKQLWNNGVSLRSERLKAVGKDTKAESLKDDLRNLKMKSLGQHAAWWAKSIPFLPRDARLSEEEQQQDFIEALASATFWGARLNISDAPSKTLGGVLLVNVSNNRILLDSEGYRRMFLHPFSLITEMNVLTLHDIKGEFGDDDSELVRIMGETVVLETFVRDEEKNAYVSCDAGFIQRTQQITAALTGPQWSLENGMDDLLRVRTGPHSEEIRWIHRSAVLQGRKGSAERIMAWRFVEMPPIVEELILQSRQAA
jgi:hypothetical protein